MGQQYYIFKVKKYRVYLCVIIDLYSRSVITWRGSRHTYTNLIITTFKEAFEERGKPQNLTVHSDRGTQHTSKTFEKLLKSVRSNTLSPRGQSCRTTLWRRLSFQHSREMRPIAGNTHQGNTSAEVLRSNIRFYNEILPTQTLNFTTPQAFEENSRSDFIEK